MHIGTGDKPIIDLSVRKTDWTPYSGSIYQRTGTGEVGGEVRHVFQDNVRLLKVASLAGMVAGSWFYSGTTIYVWLTDGGNPNTSHVVEHPIYNNAIDMNGKSFLTFNNIAGKRSKNAVFNFREVAGLHDITMSYCEASQSGFRGFDGGGNVTKYHITLDHCRAYDNNSEGIWMGLGHGFTSQQLRDIRRQKGCRQRLHERGHGRDYHSRQRIRSLDHAVLCP